MGQFKTLPGRDHPLTSEGSRFHQSQVAWRPAAAGMLHAPVSSRGQDTWFSATGRCVNGSRWRYRLTVRTDGSQPSNRGSIPRTATTPCVNTIPLDLVHVEGAEAVEAVECCQLVLEPGPLALASRPHSWPVFTRPIAQAPTSSNQRRCVPGTSGRSAVAGSKLICSLHLGNA